MSRGSNRGKRSFLARIQSDLSSFYGIEPAPDVEDFVRPAGVNGREVLLVRECSDALEIVLELPREALVHAAMSADVACQAVEGVSHFLCLAERARRELPTTQLELELQAEVDKYVVLALSPAFPVSVAGRVARAATIRDRIFGSARFLDAADTESGARYRLATGVAARFVERLETTLLRRGRFEELRRKLRRFYAAGQAEKISLALAA